MNGTFIDSITVGGSAFVSGQIMQGDEVIAIDGKKISPHNIRSELVGSDIPGSNAIFLIRRRIDAAVSRAACCA